MQKVLLNQNMRLKRKSMKRSQSMKMLRMGEIWKGLRGRMSLKKNQIHSKTHFSTFNDWFNMPSKIGYTYVCSEVY